MQLRKGPSQLDEHLQGLLGFDHQRRRVLFRARRRRWEYLCLQRQLPPVRVLSSASRNQQCALFNAWTATEKPQLSETSAAKTRGAQGVDGCGRARREHLPVQRWLLLRLYLSMFFTFSTGRSRLYRCRFLQFKAHWKAFGEMIRRDLQDRHMLGVKISITLSEFWFSNAFSIYKRC